MANVHFDQTNFLCAAKIDYQRKLWKINSLLLMNTQLPSRATLNNSMVHWIVTSSASILSNHRRPSSCGIGCKFFGTWGAENSRTIPICEQSVTFHSLDQ